MLLPGRTQTELFVSLYTERKKIHKIYISKLKCYLKGIFIVIVERFQVYNNNKFKSFYTDIKFLNDFILKRNKFCNLLQRPKGRNKSRAVHEGKNAVHEPIKKKSFPELFTC